MRRNTLPGRRRRAALTLAISAALVAGACANDPTEASSPSTTAPATAPKVTGTAAYTAAGSIEQAMVTGATAGAKLLLVDRSSKVVARGTADERGALVLYGIEPGDGYRVVDAASGSGGGALGSDPFTVLDRATVPPESLYTGQPLQQGLNYVRMRDGVTLAMTVRLPAGKALDDGPFPTLVEYSGYPTAAPHDLLSSVTARITDPTAADDPLAPSTATAVGGLIAPLLDFAVVSVQIRGSGCSGGAFDLFGLPTIYDGYDAVEVVGHQPWVKGGKVGMVGISYSGYSQLFVGGTRPPHLAALAPMSVTDDLYDGIGFPGGIFNTGFAKGWLTERQEDARPAPDGGQRWAQTLVRQGEPDCTANQVLHGQARDGLKLLSDIEFKESELFADRDPGEWARNIDVPTFIVGGLQDEQLGSHWVHVVPALLQHPDTWVTMYNGFHNDALQPAVLSRWIEFLNLFVADRMPVIPDGIRAFSGLLFDQISHVPAIELPASRFRGTDVAAAREQFRRDPRVRVLLDVGAGDLGPGALEPGFELKANTWPPESTAVTRFALGDDGRLVPGELTTDAADATYRADPDARPETSRDDGRDPLFSDQPNNWTPVAAGAGLAWVTDPLPADTVIAGTASVDLQVTATAADTDLQATLSGVRPDGQETYLETGWLRASHRALDRDRSTELDPVPTHQAADRSRLSADEPATVRISVNPVVHALRAGSRLRLTLTAPGGDRPLWTWKTIDDGRTKVTVHSTVAAPSSLAVGVVTDWTPVGPLPACGVLRGQPCRTYERASNGG